MKNFLYLLSIIVFTSCAHKKSTVLDNSIISQKQVTTNDIQLVLDSVNNDSRCPEGTNCIWAGEVTVEISVFDKFQKIENKFLTVSSKNLTENIAWLSKFYPNQKIKSIQVLPYPKSEVSIDPKRYFVKIIFE